MPRARKPHIPGHGELPEGLAPASGPRAAAQTARDGPVASLKLASGCDRRCTFCAIPAFRGAYVSRRPRGAAGRGRLAGRAGRQELVLVSENSTSYGKDLGDLRALEKLLPALAAIEGIERVRVSYLQPAELRPGLLDVIAGTEGSPPTSTCPSSTPVARCCAGCAASATPSASSTCWTRSARPAPEAGVRSNFIVGFPGETEDEFAELVASWRRPGST